MESLTKIHSTKLNKPVFDEDGSNTESFLLKLVDAGFKYCYQADRTVCTVCGLQCEHWSSTTDDPAKIHKYISPNCAWVKSKLNHVNIDDMKYDENEQFLPFNASFIPLKKRIESFEFTFLNKNLIDELANAGYFVCDHRIICFFCGHRFESFGSSEDIILQHVRQSPHCSFAKHLCGNDLHFLILHENQRASFHQTPMNILREHWEKRLRLTEQEMGKRLRDYLDLTDFRCALELFSYPTVEWTCRQFILLNKQIRFTEIIKCCSIREFCLANDNPAICPSKEVRQRKYQLTQYAEELLRKTSICWRDEILRYQTEQKAVARNFREENWYRIQREQLLSFCPSDLPADKILNGRWCYNPVGNYLCCEYCKKKFLPHHGMENLLEIHRELSPFCLLAHCEILFEESQVPILSSAEYFQRGQLIEDRPAAYSGFAPAKSSRFANINDRIHSFRHSNISPSDIRELGKRGFYYCSIGNRPHLVCFYCRKYQPAFRSDCKHYRHCRYNDQFNDSHRLSAAEGGKTCRWCKIADREVVAMPCRHLALCRPCARTKMICNICQRVVEAYLVIFL